MLIVKKNVTLQSGAGHYDSDSFIELETIGTGQLYVLQENGIIELRTRPDTAERYKRMAAEVANAAVNNSDELLERAAAIVGKSILAKITHTPPNAARHIKVTTSMVGWDRDMAQLKESNYGINEITTSIWSKKLDNIIGIRQDGAYVLLFPRYGLSYRLVFASAGDAKKCFSVVKNARGFQ